MTEGLSRPVQLLHKAVGRPASGTATPEYQPHRPREPGSALHHPEHPGKGQSFGPKEIIYRKDEYAGRVYLIRKGLVKLLTYLPNGQVRIVRLRTRDHWIGYESLMGQGYWHTAVAVDKTDVEIVPGNRLLNSEGRRSSDCLLQQCSSDLAQADHWICSFSTGEIKPRVARLLQYLAELEYGHPPRRVKLLTVQEMADILGVTQESVSRILADFKRRRILQRQEEAAREVYNLNPALLRQETLL